MKNLTPTQAYSLAQLSAMLALAELAIQHNEAEFARRMAQHAYHEKLWEYEQKFGALGSRLDPNKEEHSGAIEYTSERYWEYEKAKRQAYNLKRRMETAVRRIRASSSRIIECTPS